MWALPDAGIIEGFGCMGQGVRELVLAQNSQPDPSNKRGMDSDLPGWVPVRI